MSKGNKVLIAYESKFGSTAEIARFIGEVIEENGHSVDVLKICDVTDLSDYSRVIVGSAIQYEKWTKEAEFFVKSNEAELSNKSVSYYLVCLVLSRQTEKSVRQASGYAMNAERFAPNIKVDSFGQFSGVLNYKRMSFRQRLLARVIFTFLRIDEGDYRDWDLIRKWTRSLTLV